MGDHGYMFSGLRHAPHELKRILSAIPDEHEHEPLVGGGWSPHQIVTHLCDINANVFIPRFHLMVEQSNPFFEDFDENAWMAGHYDPSVPMQSLLEQFGGQCGGTADWLKGLTNQDWERPGTHSLRGTHPLQWWADRMIAHITEHLAELGGD